MTDNEINGVIAEACGYVLAINGYMEACWCKDREFYTIVPDYANDLNAMSEAVKIFATELYDGEDGFTANLARVTQGDTAPVDGWKFRPMQEATARQRAEAFLRTIGKWRE